MRKIVLGMMLSIGVLMAEQVRLENVTIVSNHKETKNSLMTNSNSGVSIGGKTFPSGHYDNVNTSTNKKIKNISLKNVEIKER